MTPSEIRWREKYSDKKERMREGDGRRGMCPGRGLQKCRAIRVSGMGKMCFYGQRRVSWSL